MSLYLSCKLTPNPNSHLSQITPTKINSCPWSKLLFSSKKAVITINHFQKKIERKSSVSLAVSLEILLFGVQSFKLRVILKGFGWVSIKCIKTILQPFCHKFRSNVVKTAYC